MPTNGLVASDTINFSEEFKNITGTTVDDNRALDVNVIATVGGGGGAVTQSGNWSTRTQDGSGNSTTSHSAGASRGLDVSIIDGSGNQVTSFGGTPYTEDAAAAANPIGNAIIVVRDDARAGDITSTDGDNIALRGNNSGELYVRTQENVSVIQSIASNLQAAVAGSIASDSADSGNPVKTGFRAASFGNGQTDVSDGDRSNATGTRSGVPFVLGGTSNILVARTAVTEANSNVSLIAASASQKIVVTQIQVSLGYTSLAFPAVRIGFGTATTPTTTDVVLAHDSMCPGSAISRGDGTGIIGVGALDAELRITNDNPTGAMSVIISYFITAG